MGARPYFLRRLYFTSVNKSQTLRDRETHLLYLFVTSVNKE